MARSHDRIISAESDPAVPIPEASRSPASWNVSEETDNLIGEFAEEIEEVLSGISVVCEGLSARDMHHWSVSQHEAIECMRDSIQQALTVLRRVRNSFGLPTDLPRPIN